MKFSLPESPTSVIPALKAEPANPMEQVLVIYPAMILRQKVTTEIKIFDRKINKLVIDMFSIMRELNGMGLAAPQIGKKLPIIVYSVGQDQGCMINPVITQKSGKVVTRQEGCLSMPGLKINVPRYEKIRVQYQDVDGMIQTLDASDTLARCIQHEVDHLSGKTMLDYISGLARDVFTRKLKKTDRIYTRHMKRQREQERKEFNKQAKKYKKDQESLTPPQI